MDILGRSWISRQCRRATLNALSVAAAIRDPAACVHRYAELTPDAARAQALEIWRPIDLENFEESILPTRRRPRRIPRQAPDHRIETVALRRI